MVCIYIIYVVTNDSLSNLESDMILFTYISRLEPTPGSFYVCDFNAFEKNYKFVIPLIVIVFMNRGIRDDWFDTKYTGDLSDFLRNISTSYIV